MPSDDGWEGEGDEELLGTSKKVQFKIFFNRELKRPNFFKGINTYYIGLTSLSLGKFFIHFRVQR